MSIREVTESASVSVRKTHRMTRIIVDEDRTIFAVWVVELGDERREERSVRISADLNDNAKVNATVMALVDAIRDDTFPRAVPNAPPDALAAVASPSAEFPLTTPKS